MFYTMFNYFEKKGLDFDYNSHEQVTDGSFETSMTDLILRAVTMPDYGRYNEEYDYEFDNTEEKNAEFDRIIERDDSDKSSRYDFTDYSDALDSYNRYISETRNEIQSKKKNSGTSENTTSPGISREDTKDEETVRNG